MAGIVDTCDPWLLATTEEPCDESMTDTSFDVSDAASDNWSTDLFTWVT